MSASTELALPQKVVIEGGQYALYPIGVYELGLLERSYAASLRYEAIESTLGLPPSERRKALEAASERVNSLAVSMRPLIEWIALTNNGMVTAVSVCLQSVQNEDEMVSKRVAGRWFDRIGGVNSEQIERWLIDSGIRSDPTEPAPETSSQSEQKSKSDSQEQPEQSTDGATG